MTHSNNSKCLPAFACRIVAALITAVTLAGCGGRGDGIERVEISGKVTYLGEPVEEGYISFEPIGNGIQSGAKITKGDYHAFDRGAVPVGNYIVRISWPKEDKAAQRPGMPVAPQVEVLPGKYNIASELTLEVPTGEGHMSQDYILD